MLRVNLSLEADCRRLRESHLQRSSLSICKSYIFNLPQEAACTHNADSQTPAGGYDYNSDLDCMIKFTHALDFTNISSRYKQTHSLMRLQV